MNIQSNTEHRRAHSALSGSRVLTFGLAVAVGLWVVWLALHLPGLALPPRIAGPTMVGGWLLIALGAARLYRPSPAEGAIGGLISAAVSLLALGSMLVEQPDPALYAEGRAPLRPAAGLIVAGFLAAGAAVGAVGSLLGARGAAADRPPASDLDPWPARLAGVVALAYVPLVLLGGLVTSTESGMAVRGWPDTFGANMFLYPVSLMSQPRIFLEHSHRLFGTLAGLATVVLWVSTLLSPGARRRFGVWTTALFVAVCIQGYLGGQRVVLNNPYMGAVHGAFGQVLLAFAATLALWMSPHYRELPSIQVENARAIRFMTTGALHASLLQLFLGALFRHLRRGENPGASHVVWTHAAFAFVVVALAIIAGSILIRTAKRHRDDFPPGLARRLRLHGIGIHATVGIQFVLGWFTLLAVMTGPRRGPVPTADELHSAAEVPLLEAILATAHQANGALFLVIVMLAWAWGRRFHRASLA